MNIKSLMMLGLLAAAPVVSQAAMKDMNEADLSTVHGQKTLQGQLFTYSANLALNPYHVPFSYDVSPDVGGFKTTLDWNWEIFPAWSVSATGNYTGNSIGASGSGNWDPIDVSFVHRYRASF